METQSQDKVGVKTRHRRAIACLRCRQRKLRCDRQQPCRNCTRSRDSHTVCSYATTSLSSVVSKVQAAHLSAPDDTLPDTGVYSQSITNRGSRIGPEIAIVPNPRPQDSLSPTQDPQEDQQWVSTSVADLLVDVMPSMAMQESQTCPDSTAERGNHERVTEQSGISCLFQDLTNPISALMVKTRFFSPSSWIYSIFLVYPSRITVSLLLHWLTLFKQN